MLKLIKYVLVVFLICVLIATFFRHTICRILIAKAVTETSELKLYIEDLNLDLLNNTLHLRGITLFNPPEFNNEVLGQVKEILIKYNLLDSLSGKFHFTQVKADISEINIIKNKRGDSNISSLQKKNAKLNIPSEPSSSPATGKQSKEDKRRYPQFFIDRLEILLKKVAFIDYRAGIGEPAVIIFNAQGPLVFKEVNDLSCVVNSLSSELGIFMGKHKTQGN